METLIELDKVSKNYSEPVLESISFKLDKGEQVSILGPSGCGKSTLLRIIKGLETQSSGNVVTEGDIGLMFQEPRLFKWRTVGENISLAGELDGDKIDEEKISRLLKLVGLYDKKEMFPSNLSGGEKQRVALARTLSTDPDVLLMDEPLSSLDERTRTRLQEEFIDICVETGKTTVFVTHSVREAWKMGDRIIVFTEKPTNIKKEFKKQEGRKEQQIKEIRKLVKS